MSILAYSDSRVEETIPFCEGIIESSSSLSLQIPKRPLAKQSLQVVHKLGTSYLNWTGKEHSSAFFLLQKVVKIWEVENIAGQYLIYAKQSLEKDTPFRWEIVPFQEKSTCLGRIWQQFLVLWKVSFGGGALLSEKERKKELGDYRSLFHNFSSPPLQKKKIVKIGQGEDAFCKSQVIQKQLVLEGKLIYVLYNYAPIGFGGEKLHFLFLPKKHKEKFSELTEEEYIEATQLMHRVTSHFTNTRSIQNVYFLHKTGKDAGQTVDHWHMHLILTSKKTQDFLGKCTVFKNMLLGSSPMAEDVLKEKVSQLSSELQR